MNKIEIAKQILIIIQIRGYLSNELVKNYITSFSIDNEKKYHYLYDILRPLYIAGLIEYADKKWFLSPSIVIKKNDDNYIIFNPRNKMENYIIEVKSYNFEFPLLNIDVYKEFMKNIPSLSSLLFKDSSLDLHQYSKLYSVDRKEYIKTIKIKDDMILRESEIKYSKWYFCHNKKLYKIDDFKENPDHLFLFRLFLERKNISINNNNIIFRNINIIPSIIGRLLFIFSDRNIERLFDTRITFNISDDDVLQYFRKFIGDGFGYY